MLSCLHFTLSQKVATLVPHHLCVYTPTAGQGGKTLRGETEHNPTTLLIKFQPFEAEDPPSTQNKSAFTMPTWYSKTDSFAICLQIGKWDLECEYGGPSSVPACCPNSRTSVPHLAIYPPTTCTILQLMQVTLLKEIKAILLLFESNKASCQLLPC